MCWMRPCARLEAPRGPCCELRDQLDHDRCTVGARPRLFSVEWISRAHVKRTHTEPGSGLRVLNGAAAACAALSATAAVHAACLCYGAAGL